MKVVSGHMTDRARALKQVEMVRPIVQGAIMPARERQSLFNLLLMNAITQVGALVVAAPDSPEVCDVLAVATQAATAIFATASIDSDYAEVRLDNGPPIRLPATGPTNYANVINWRLGFFVAAICRNRDALDILCQTPINVLRQAGATSEECVYLFAEALQSLWRRDNDVGERIRLALEATDPNRIEEDAVDFVLNQIVPEINLVYRFVLQHPADFNEALIFALQRHKKYWSKANRKRNPIGWIALGPLAIASFAYDAEMPINVESPYLPLNPVQGDCA